MKVYITKTVQRPMLSQAEQDKEDLRTAILNRVYYTATVTDLERLEMRMRDIKDKSKNTGEIKELVTMLYYLQRARGLAERFVKANS